MLPVSADTAAAVRVERVNHVFGEGDSRNQVLFDNSISIRPGELVILTGPSGSGKTTLLTLIGALRSVQDGEISLYGKDLGGLPAAGLVEVRRGIGFIFQMHNLFESLTAYENVKMGMQVAGIAPGEMRSRGEDILKRLGLSNRIDYKPGALSGGQRQRVAIARALVHRPALVLADEPTAALDKDSGRDVVDLLKELARQHGSAILMVTHDNRVIESADRIINMVDGRIVSDVELNETLNICEYLRNSSIFRHMSPHEISNVAGKVLKRGCDAGTVIVKQGEMGDQFFLIAEGTANVDINGTAAATLGAGEFFGEASLISGAPRNATVSAATPMLLYVLGKADFRSALDSNESFKEQIYKVIFQRQ
jgi:putative ABC transport system ATP-binding protein